MNVETLDPWAQQILGALFNGGYQGLLLTLAVALVLRWTPRANAATRHAVWFVTLLLVALLPVLHGVRDVGFGSRLLQAVVESQSGPLPMEILEPSTMGPAVPSADLNSVPLQNPDGEPHEPMGHLGIGWVEEGRVPSLESIESVERVTDPEEQAAPAAVAGGMPWRFSLPTGWPVVLVAIWWGIAGVRLLALAWQLGHLRSLKQCATPAPADWQELFAKAAVEMELRRPTRLALAADVSTPMVIGLGRPTVVLPSAGFEQISKDQLQQVLRHELGHVVRGDDWMNLIQQVIRAVLFFHPAVGWVSRRLTLEREVACDDHVLAAPGSPKAYALLLTEFAGRMPGRDFAAAPAAWNHQTQLKERIHMILDSKRNASPRLVGVRLAILTAATLGLAGLALNAAPRISLESDSPSAVELATTDTAENELVGNEVTLQNPSPLVVRAEPTLVIRTDSATTVAEPTQLTVSSDGRLEASSITLVSGPKVKKLAVDPVEPVAPPTPDLAVPPVPPEPVAEAPAPVAPRHPDSSLERRLDRLERLMNQLMGSGDTKSLQRSFGGVTEEQLAKLKVDADLMKQLGRPGEAKSVSRNFSGINEEQLAKLKADFERAARDAVSKEDLARIQSRAEAEIFRAKREVERAQRAQAKLKSDHQSGQELDQVNAQRRALEVRRKALEQQMDSLEAEMEKLEEMQERLQEKARDVGPGKPVERGASTGPADSDSGADKADSNLLRK